MQLMDRERGKSLLTNLCSLSLCLFVLALALSFTQCADARRLMRHSRGPTRPTSSIIQSTKKIQLLKKWFDIVGSGTQPLQNYSYSDTEPYAVSSPFSLPPYDSLAPIPLPENTPPFCLYPPLTPQTPSTTIPTPVVGDGGGIGGGYTPPYTQVQPPPPPSSSFPPINPIQSSPPPPPSSEGTFPNPPEYVPSPYNPPEIVPPSPQGNTPSPPQYVPSSPPLVYVPSPTQPALTPPFYEPSPPSFNIPSPSPPSSIFVPSPTVFQPPVVYPPPAVPPPPHTGPAITLWCVAKPSVPEPIIQEAMNYACGSGADCDSIQADGSCFEPNTVIAHASYAFNSYWQRSKVAGGTCSFGGAAMLVSVDPSNDGCHFTYY